MRVTEQFQKMYISTIRPHFDYCSQLWGPGEGPLLDKLEKVQAYFTRLIPEIRDLPYPERLKRLRLQSIQRRFDRYKITYIRKILKNLVPNPGITQRTDAKHRLGVMVEIPKAESKLRYDSFLVRGPKIFNSLPKELRDLEVSMDTFKEHLDEYLNLVPDIPRSYGYESNELEERTKFWRWKVC